MAPLAASAAILVVSSLGEASGWVRFPGSAPASALRPNPNDATAWLQARLDRRGGRLFLPRLPAGQCYRTRGLWVSRNGTTIASDGGCIELLGPGPMRLRSPDGDPVAATAALFVNRSSPGARPPEDVRIRGLRIVVPPGNNDGIDVYGRRVTISDVTIEGRPLDDVYIGGRANGVGHARDVALLDSRLRGARRNAVSVTAAIGVRIARNVIAGAGVAGVSEYPGAGIDVEPNAPTDPITRIVIERNLIVDNLGPGVAVALGPRAERADQIAIVGNRIVGNSVRSSSTYRGGIVFSGGQGDAFVLDNVVRGNSGGGLVQDRFARLGLRLSLEGNVFTENGGAPRRARAIPAYARTER